VVPESLKGLTIINKFRGELEVLLIIVAKWSKDRKCEQMTQTEFIRGMAHVFLLLLGRS